MKNKSRRKFIKDQLIGSAAIAAMSMGLPASVFAENEFSHDHTVIDIHMHLHLESYGDYWEGLEVQMQAMRLLIAK